MSNYILTAAGSIIFLGGLYLYHTKKESLKFLQLIGLATYAGYSMLLIGFFPILTPLFESIFGDYAARARAVVQVVLFFAGAEKLLKPVFEDQIIHKESDKKITPNGTKKSKKKHK